MVKTIPFREVRPGDVVEVVTDGKSEELTVARIENGSAILQKFLMLWFENGLMTPGHPDELIGLVRRTCTREESDVTYRHVVALLEQTTRRTSPLGAVIDTTKFPALLEALQDYELGKPKESASLGVSSDPLEAENDASCGYLGGGPVA